MGHACAFGSVDPAGQKKPCSQREEQGTLRPVASLHKPASHSEQFVEPGPDHEPDGHSSGSNTPLGQLEPAGHFSDTNEKAMPGPKTDESVNRCTTMEPPKDERKRFSTFSKAAATSPEKGPAITLGVVLVAL